MNVYQRILSVCFFLSAFVVCGQELLIDTTTREAQIQLTAEDNMISALAVTPALQQIQGAPKAFYTYFWEFGDGHYSFDPQPKHSYQKTGDKTVLLYVTNNYDNGKPPPSRPQKVPIKKITHLDKEVKNKLLPEDDGFLLQINRAPVPEQEIVMIASYANDQPYLTDGKFYIFYNEKKFKDANFSLEDVRTHHGEKEIQEPFAVASMQPKIPNYLMASNTDFFLPYENSDESENDELAMRLQESRLHYRNVHVLEFNAMEAGEERNVFYTFKTTPQMLKDTSETVTIRGVYVPDRGKGKHTVKTLEMEIVKSHDPNKMAVSDGRLNYRFYKSKKLWFKVRFQNNGEGPARSIKLNVSVSDMFDKSTLRILEMYPACPICPDSLVSYSCLDTLLRKDSIIFHFRNIYLPGSDQQNVQDKDSTKGFVKYEIQFRDEIPKRKSLNRTAIVFDKNEPILTNYSGTRFKPGLSPGIKVGLNVLPDLQRSKNYFLGISLSPYKSYNVYWQTELLVARHTFTETRQYEQIEYIPGADLADLYAVTERSEFTNLALYVVPVSFRYSLNKVLGIGTGIQVGTNVREKNYTHAQYDYYQYFPLQRVRIRDQKNDFSTDKTERQSFTKFNGGIFADLTIGLSRIGPSAGIRYTYQLEYPVTQWQFYLLWKL